MFCWVVVCSSHDGATVSVHKKLNHAKTSAREMLREYGISSELPRQRNSLRNWDGQGSWVVDLDEDYILEVTCKELE